MYKLNYTLSDAANIRRKIRLIKYFFISEATLLSIRNQHSPIQIYQYTYSNIPLHLFKYITTPIQIYFHKRGYFPSYLKILWEKSAARYPLNRRTLKVNFDLKKHLIQHFFVVWVVTCPRLKIILQCPRFTTHLFLTLSSVFIVTIYHFFIIT